MRSSARIAGRDPEALQYTRWGSIDLTSDRIEVFSAQGVDGLVISPSVGRVEDQLDELSAFAEQHLGRDDRSAAGQLEPPTPVAASDEQLAAVGQRGPTPAVA